jgi:hypothetical protein
LAWRRGEVNGEPTIPQMARSMAARVLRSMTMSVRPIQLSYEGERSER